MKPVKHKYETKCYLNETESLIRVDEFETKNEDEARARGYINCYETNHKRRNIHVEVEKQ